MADPRSVCLIASYRFDKLQFAVMQIYIYKFAHVAEVRYKPQMNVAYASNDRQKISHVIFGAIIIKIVSH